MAGQDNRPHYTGIKFDGTNFESWQFGVRLVLQSEELWNIAKGNELKPQPINLHNSCKQLCSDVPHEDHVRGEIFHV